MCFFRERSHFQSFHNSAVVLLASCTVSDFRIISFLFSFFCFSSLLKVKTHGTSNATKRGNRASFLIRLPSFYMFKERKSAHFIERS